MGYIYLITNKTNGKRYVGMTRKPIEERFRKHKYCAAEPKTHLHRAMSKHGFDAFELSLLEEVLDIKMLARRERHYISELKPEYNMTEGGEGGDTSASPNYKAAIARRSMKGASNPMFGRKRVGETHHWSEGGRSSFKKKVACPVQCEGVTYDSVADAQKAYPGCNIRKRLDNPRYPDFIRLRERTRRGSQSQSL